MNTIRTIFAYLAVLMLCLGATTLCHGQALSVSRKQPTSSTALLLASGDPARGSILIENVGSYNVSVSNISTVATTTGIVVTPNQQLLCVGVSDQFYAIAASSTADLRVTTTTNPSSPGTNRPLPSCSVSRLTTTGITNTAAANTIPMSDGTNIVVGNVIYKMLTAAITPNSTTCADASGSLAITSNATGLGTVFRCDGTNYQLLATYSDASINGTLGTIATTSNTDEYVIAPFAGTFTAGDFSGVDALTASNSNYITFSVTNLGQSGSGSNPLLAATAANTTQSTGGTAIAANTKWTFTINGTGSNLIVAKGDRLRIRAAATGTLANTVTFARVRLYFTRLS